MNENKYLMRSLMFVPGHNEKLLKSASQSNADVLLFDIEDSVQPFENKQIARENILKWVSNGSFKNHLVFPRVNDRESGQLLRDIYQLTIDGVDGFMFPKAKDGDDIYFFSKLLETIEYEKGIPTGTFKIIPLIETASALIKVDNICKASKRVVGIAFGCEDYITDIQGIHDKEGESIFTARSIVSVAARANNIIPIDTVHIKIHDLEDLEKNLILSKKLGYEGMLVLHPKELPLVHKYYSPSVEEFRMAEEMLKLSKIAEEDNKGVAILDGKFVGPPMVAQAKKVINRYKEILKRNTAK